MRNPRFAPILAAILALSVALGGCLSGPTPPPKVAVSFLSDAEVLASPGWTVGWAVEVFESVTDNGTVAVTSEAPPGWAPRFIKPEMLVEKANGRKATFLLVDIPADAANGTYSVKVRAAMGADTAEVTGTVKISRPALNLVKNGTAVQMDYIGFLDTNQVFDTSMFSVANSSGLDKWPDFVNSSKQRTEADYHPLSFTEGRRQVIRGWEVGIEGMALAQGKALIIPSEDAYGRYVNQSINITNSIPIYNQTTIAAFQPLYGGPPVEDAQYTEPTFGWTVRVVSVDNATGTCVLENLVDMNKTYKPFGVNATVSSLSSATGNFTLTYAPALNGTGVRYMDTGIIVDLNATAFTMRWQTEHQQTLAPYTLYFLVFVRSAAG